MNTMVNVADRQFQLTTEIVELWKTKPNFDTKDWQSRCDQKAFWDKFDTALNDCDSELKKYEIELFDELERITTV